MTQLTGITLKELEDRSNNNLCMEIKLSVFSHSGPRATHVAELTEDEFKAIVDMLKQFSNR